MATKMRWSNSGASVIGPRDGAMLRSPITEAAPARLTEADRERLAGYHRDQLALFTGARDAAPRPQSTHVHIHGTWSAPVRDQGIPSGAPTPRTEASAPGRGDPEPQGELLCRLGKDGRDNKTWRAEAPDGSPLVIRQGGDGRYEILRPSGNSDAHVGAPGEFRMEDPLAADQRRIAARLAPGHGPGAIDQRNPEGLRALSAMLSAHYARPA
jgi:hypothetical protein